MNRTIYPSKSQTLQEFFTNCGSLEKVLLVPVDYAKESHTVQFCLGTGRYLLKKPLNIYNNVEGLQYFCMRLKKIMSRYHIQKGKVLIVSEDPPRYLYNFMDKVRRETFMWVRVNAGQAVQFRETLRASSDTIDLSGIAGAAINRKGVIVEDFSNIYATLKSAARSRLKLVRNETAVKNRIHDCVDILFQGFLSESKSGLLPFSPASLWLMEETFSAGKIRRMGHDTLVKNFRRFGLHNPEGKAEKLKEFAATVLDPPAELIPYTQSSLGGKVRLLREIKTNLFLEENEMARALVQTPLFYATSIPGIGVVLAGQIAAELGDFSKWPELKNINSYAGIAPRSYQTGGPSKPAVTGKLPHQCNHILKNYLLMAAHHVGTTPQRNLTDIGLNPRHTLYSYFQAVENRNGHARIATAKKLLKVCKKLAVEQRFYLPQEWMHSSLTPSSEDNNSYFSTILDTVKGKWKDYDLSEIATDMNLLTQEKLSIKSLIEFVSKK